MLRGCRYATGRTCTLVRELEDICQVKSVLGANGGGYRGLYMNLGGE